MKKILYSFLLFLTFSSLESTAQYFQATIVIDNTIPDAAKLRFKLKVTGGDLTNFQFDGMEYFVRKPSADAATVFGNITNNQVDFPGLEITKGGGGANFINGYDAEPGFTNFYFYGKSVGATTSAKDYLNGVEYEVFSVDISAAGSNNFEFAGNNAESFPYYLTLSRKSDPGGQPDYTAISSHGNINNHLYFGGGLSKVGANYYQKPGLLPVKFLSFYALKNGDDAKLSWTVENDFDNRYFEIERSLNGRNFSTIAKVNAFGNGSSLNTYETADPRLSGLGSELVYYRIKQVDINGSITYSTIRNLNLTLKNNAINLFPNPARTITKLVIDATMAGKATIIIRDATGKQVQMISTVLVLGINQKDLNVAALPSGEYNVTVMSEKYTQNIKLSKIN